MKSIFAIPLVPVLLAVALAGCGGDDPKGTSSDNGSTEAVEGGEPNFEASMQTALTSLANNDVAGAAKAADEAVAANSESAEALLVRGQAAYRAKDYKRALADFSAVVNEKSLPAGLRSDAWVARGVTEMAQKNHESARISFLRAMRLNRKNAAAWYHQGVLLRDVYHFDDAAIEQFTMAAGCPGVPADRVKKIRGEILPALMKSSQAATASLLGSGKRDSALAAKLIAEGDGLQKKNLLTAAAKKYEAALAADRTSESAAAKFATLIPKVDKSATGVTKALEAYRVLCALRPSRLANYQNAALLAYQNKRWAMAVQIMDRALARYPEDTRTLDLLIASLKKAGRTRLQEAWGAYRAELK